MLPEAFSWLRLSGEHRTRCFSLLRGSKMNPKLLELFTTGLSENCDMLRASEFITVSVLNGSYLTDGYWASGLSRSTLLCEGRRESMIFFHC